MTTDKTRIIVHYGPGFDKGSLAAFGDVLNDIPEISALFLRPHVEDTDGNIAYQLRALPGVTLVEYNQRIPVRERLHTAVVPTDTLRVQNQAIYDEMNLSNAWGVTTGDPRIKIGVLDSGVDMRHPDINCLSGGVFQDGIYTTNNHLPMQIDITKLLAGVDVAFGGSIDAVYAYEHDPNRLYLGAALVPAPFFTDSSCNTLAAPTGTPVSGTVWIDRPIDLDVNFIDINSVWLRGVGLEAMWDGWGHGTAIAGLISSPHNGNGFCGIAPGCTTVMYQIVNSEYVMNAINTVAAVMRAVADGCHVLSLSYGGPAGTNTQAEVDAYNYAMGQGCIIVCSAGNAGQYPYTDTDADALDYPSAQTGVIGVGACGDYNHRVGNGNIDIVAADLDFSRMSWFTQKFPQVDIIAPGWGWIFHAPLGLGSMWAEFIWNKHSRYFTTQADGGTSFSCPAVAAIIALCMSYKLAKDNITAPVIARNTYWTLSTVEGWLTAGAKLPVKLSNGNAATKGYGRGRLDAYLALGGV